MNRFIRLNATCKATGGDKVRGKFFFNIRVLVAVIIIRICFRVPWLARRWTLLWKRSLVGRWKTFSIHGLVSELNSIHSTSKGKYFKQNLKFFPHKVFLLTLFSLALCDDHTPHATSPAAFCHNLANFYPNSNFDIARAWTEESSVLFVIWAIFDNNCGFYSKMCFPLNWAAKPHAK